MHDAEAILRDWFSDPERWWGTDPAFDRYLRETYRDDVEAALRGERDGWSVTPRGALALVILLDQIARNIHRGTPRMYAGDAKALSTSFEVIGSGQDASLSEAERQFLYMPLMHSEDRFVQRRSLEKFAELSRSFDYAKSHADIVFRFGRFPHRNAILGRESTPEEIEFLKQPGSAF